MHPPSVSTVHGGPPPSALRRAVHRTQSVFLAVNAVPFAAGLLLFPFTAVASVRVAGNLTLCMAWGIAQCGLFAASAWWYENRSAHICDPPEDLPASDAPPGAFDRQGW